MTVHVPVYYRAYCPVLSSKTFLPFILVAFILAIVDVTVLLRTHHNREPLSTWNRRAGWWRIANVGDEPLHNFAVSARALTFVATSVRWRLSFKLIRCFCSIHENATHIDRPLIERALVARLTLPALHLKED